MHAAHVKVQRTRGWFTADISELNTREVHLGYSGLDPVSGRTRDIPAHLCNVQLNEAETFATPDAADSVWTKSLT